MNFPEEKAPDVAVNRLMMDKQIIVSGRVIFANSERALQTFPQRFR